MKLSGRVWDRYGKALEGVTVEVKDEDFETLYKAESDKNGNYAIDLPATRFPFVTAVKEYAQNYLEYWCHNVDMSADKELNMTVDTLEIYGTNVFEIKGGYNGLMVYFRPMSLKKFKSGLADICPDIKHIIVCVDGQNAEVLTVNKVKEYGEGTTMTAFLLHVKNPNADRSWSKTEITVYDEDGNYGMASVFN